MNKPVADELVFIRPTWMNNAEWRRASEAMQAEWVDALAKAAQR